MNNGNLNEILTKEELTELNEKLKAKENITLPESLSPENMAEKLENIEQFVPNGEKKATKERNKKKIIFRSLATAAAFVIAFTSVMIIKPWEKEPPIKNGGETSKPVEVQDYAEIETMFAQYSENYKEYYESTKYSDVLDNFNLFGSKADSAIDEDLREEVIAQNSASAPSMNGSSTVVGSSSSDTNSPTTPVAQATQKNEHGETNEQVKGVSEADIIKNDGKYLYIVNPDNADWGSYYDELYSDLEETTVKGGQSTPGYNPNAKITDPVPESAEETEKLSEKTESGMPILKYDCSISVVLPESDGSMGKVFTFDIAKPENENIYYMDISEMYVSGDKLIALVNCRKYNDREETSENSKTYRSGCYYGSNDLTLTMAVCFDISNRAEPVETWRIYQDGNYVSSRLIGNQLVMISNYYVDISLDEETVKKTCVPEIGCDSAEMQRVDKDCISVMENVYDSRYIVVSTLNTNDKETLKTQAILGAGENVYCTTETLYATSTDYDYDSGVEEIFGATSSQTQIYKFDIRNFDVKYLGCGAVDGRALNQFSIDEYNGYLRIATTTGDWGDSLVNQLYVLDGDLNIVGLVENMAKGETIKSVRFTGNTGYVVTFEQTDPLFVIDLTDPKAPKIKGELKIPGFSTYLHPVGDNLVLGVGVDGDENGQNGGMKVSLFDVSDPENPVECDKVTVSGNNTDYRRVYVNSAAYHTHKAMCWDSANNTMYIPYGKSEDLWASYDGSGYSHKDVGGILAVTVDTNNKKLSTSANYVSNSTEYKNSIEFTRTTYINNIIFGYSSADNILTSFDKTTQKQLYSVKIG